MKILAIYDSAYGNTQRIADTINEAVYNPHVSKLVHINQVTLSDMQGIDMLIIGSPTQGGMATKPVQEFIASMPKGSLNGVDVAAFDTRYALSEHGIGLKVLMKTIGFGAPRILTGLVAKGGKSITKPEGFLVENKEGPLKDGEIERAEAWIGEIIDRSKRA